MDYPTHNTRLLYYEVYDTSGAQNVVLRTVGYAYYDNGHASNITIKDEYVAGAPGRPAHEWMLRVAYWSRWQLDAGDVFSIRLRTFGNDERKVHGPRVAFLRRRMKSRATS